MNEEMVVVKNEDYIMDIVGVGNEGEGIGKVNNFTVFVQGALLGENIKVKILKVNKNFAFGRLEQVIKASEYRCEPLCKVYKRCGGCNLQHMTYEGQLLYKNQKVKDCLLRIGKLPEDSFILHDTLGMEVPYEYRNKVQLPVGEKDGHIVAGFYAERSHDIIQMDNCLIQEKTTAPIVNIIKQWMEDNKVRPYNESTGIGLLRHIIIRKAFKTNEIMVILVTTGPGIPNKDELVVELKTIESIKSIIQNINNKKTNVITGDVCKVLWGREYIVDKIGNFTFNVSPLSFLQVNPIQTEVLYSKVMEYADLKGNEVVFDAYCGTGTISLFLSQKASKVYGVEIVEEAIKSANINAEKNGINNVEFLTGESEKLIPELIKKGIHADVVVVDPPRKGCDQSLLEAIAEMAPKKIIYVSCDPATLARDLNILSGRGYEVKEVQPVDMFPMTGHVETVVKMSRIDKVM